MRRVISSLWILALALVPTLGHAQASDAHVAPVWLTPGRCGELIFRDMTGSVRDGINSGMVARANYYSATGGAAQILATLYAPTIPSGQSFSVWAWIRGTSGSAEHAAMGCNQGAPGALIDLELWSTGLGAYFGVRDDDSSVVDFVAHSSINWRDSAWHFLCGVYDADAGQMRLFVDLTQRSSTNITANSNAKKTLSAGIGLGAIQRSSGSPLRPVVGDISTSGFEWRAMSISDQGAAAARWKP